MQTFTIINIDIFYMRIFDIILDIIKHELRIDVDDNWSWYIDFEEMNEFDKKDNFFCNIEKSHIFNFYYK